MSQKPKINLRRFSIKIVQSFSFHWLLFGLSALVFNLADASANRILYLQPDTTGQKHTLDTAKRRMLLGQILSLLPSDITKNGHISYRDETFKDWLKRTGELPPDFDRMPSIPYLPNPLILDEGGENIAVRTKKQWEEKRVRIEQALQYYITGSFPPSPTNLRGEVLNTKNDGALTIRTVRLSFGPNHMAKMTLELMIPSGKGPFPVFMTQWNHRNWAAIAARRGYIGCIYAGADIKDDTENYGEVWSGKYDFSRLMRRAFGASRVVDYLYTLPIVNKKQIGISGHSRNGKQSLWAAAFDRRIGAVITSSGGSGGEVPWRYSRHKYDCEDIALLSCAQPSWLNPRLRFFIGRENKLPVDQNFFMALVAPRGLMLSSSRRESDGNSWGIEQAYDSTLNVYRFLGRPEHLAIRLRDGKHGTSARDIEEYIDFFDYVFGRGSLKPANELLYNYSFSKWHQLSGENINPLDYPVKGLDDLLVRNGSRIQTVEEWEKKKMAIQHTLRWVLGQEPQGVTNAGPRNFDNMKNSGEDYYGTIIGRPAETSKIGRIPIAPGHSKPGFGDYLYGYLYYPKSQEVSIRNGTAKLPVVILMHEFNYSSGFFNTQGFDHVMTPFLSKLIEKGYAVMMYDMMGFGNRIEEGTKFYQRYPHWSKFGKFVADLKGAVDALSGLNFVNASRISVMGYSLGATVGLYEAALDKRICGVVSVCGFTPMRLDTPDKGTEGIKGYSYLRGLLPRLGFFVGNESRIPYDFDGILSCIAPRPLLVVAPVLDEDATLTNVQNCVDKSRNVYSLYNASGNIQIYFPYDYNRFSKIMQDRVLKWYDDRNTENLPRVSGWEVLFDGGHTDKWVTTNGEKFPGDVWEVKNGTLSVGHNKRRRDIITKGKYGSFELVFDFKLTDTANGGIKYFVNKIKDKKTGKMVWNGPEYQIIDDYNHPAVKGQLHDVGSTASLYLLYAPQNKKLFPAGQWNHGRIVAKGRHIEHWLNGVKVVDCERGSEDFRRRVSTTKFKSYDYYGESPNGHIMLTDHGGDRVYYKNIKIRRLD